MADSKIGADVVKECLGCDDEGGTTEDVFPGQMVARPQETETPDIEKLNTDLKILISGSGAK